jgi:hypothetical protein
MEQTQAFAELLDQVIHSEPQQLLEETVLQCAERGFTSENSFIHNVNEVKRIYGCQDLSDLQFYQQFTGACQEFLEEHEAFGGRSIDTVNGFIPIVETCANDFFGKDLVVSFFFGMDKKIHIYISENDNVLFDDDKMKAYGYPFPYIS